MPAYLKIGSWFERTPQAIGGKYFGPVIVSADAFFLVILKTPAQTTLGSIGHSFGAVGVVVGVAGAIIGGMAQLAGELLGAAISDYRHVLLYDLSQLPKQITRHPDWPIKHLTQGPVIVIPRVAVDRIYYAEFDSLYIDCGEDAWCITLKFFGRRRLNSFLRQSNWQKSLVKGPSLAVQCGLVFGGLLAGAFLGTIAAVVLGVSVEKEWASFVGLVGLGALLGSLLGAGIWDLRFRC